MSSHVETATRIYVWVWIALLALLALTIGIAYLPLGLWVTPLHIVITLTQASLVMLFSMHLRAAHPMIRVAAGVGFVGILLLIVLSLFDVLTR